MASSPFHTCLLKDKAVPTCEDVMVSRDSVAWTHMAVLYITNKGAIVGVDAKGGQQSILMGELQSCHVLINTLASTHHLRRRFTKNKPEPEAGGHETPPTLHIRSTSNEKLYLELPSQPLFVAMLSSLLAWQNLKPQGLAKKWFAVNKAKVSHRPASDSHELLVCRFKIYAPIPSKAKSVNVVSGPSAPGYFDEPQSPISSTFAAISLSEGPVPEGWFYTMGVLKSNGMLNFITELDGTLLYSIDVSRVLSSEIREVHHSICHSPNTLFIGHIGELRLNNVIKSTTSITLENTSRSLLSKDGRPVASNSRILIEFPLHIDLEDWFVGLNYFCRREYIGIYDENSRFIIPARTRVVDIEGTIDEKNTSESDRDSEADSTTDVNMTFASVETSEANKNHELSSCAVGKPPQRVNPKLADFTRDHLRVSKKVTLDIIEANLDHLPPAICSDEKLYAEVLMWGYPWARTSVVDYTQNPFWKEEFSTDLPVLTQMLRIVIKQCSGSKGYSTTDRVIGKVYITPDILTQKLRNLSTMMVESNSGESIKVSGLFSVSSNLQAAAIAAPLSNNIIRLSIYDENNLPVGKLLLTVDLKEYFILPPPEFRNLENMLMSCPMKQLVEFCNTTVNANEIENVSYILLDIFQSLGIEEEWFKSLIDVELVAVDKITRKNYQQKKANLPQSANIFNTLFRGSSIFTKSLEKYNFRVGQEYLEKVFGNFFEKISTENKNCEIDPRYIRLQEKAKKKCNESKETEDEDLDYSDTDSCNSEEEELEEKRQNEILNNNFENLYAYTKDIWSKIYHTSNDLPQQIKNQLKNFRSKVDLVCDPEDKSTSLNCLSAFLFLRFFCPAILNPKLFYLTKNHQTGNVQRTLTVIAKILLNLANRQLFSPNKEAHLVKMNGFLKNHEHEVLDYFDKVSGRKNDFNEKTLDLSHEMKRFDLGLSADSASSELPTTPYLIDKNLRLTELIHLLQVNGSKPRHQRMALSVSLNSFATTINLDMSASRCSQSGVSNLLVIQHERGSSLEGGNDIHLNSDRNVYQIGSLEFEKSEFLDLAGDNETEGFIKSLCRSNEEIFSFINSNVTLKDLQKESAALSKKISVLAERLQQAEDCSNLKHDETLWEAFVNDVVLRAFLDLNKNCIAYFEPSFQGTRPPNHRLLVDSTLSALKLRIAPEIRRNLTDTFTSASITNLMKRNSKNPFKRWLKKD